MNWYWYAFVAVFALLSGIKSIISGPHPWMAILPFLIAGLFTYVAREKFHGRW